MSTEIQLAFDDLEARARDAARTATDDQPPDRISLRDHLVDVEIGAFQAERGTTQRVSFNVVVEVQPPSRPLHDDVDRILSYDTITDAIGFELAAERLNLLETLAERIADRILTEPRARRVFIRIEKLDRGPGALGVEIVRCREADGGPALDSGAELTRQPLVVFLSNEAVKSNNLPGWIDQLANSGKPVVFCLGAADLPVPQASAPAAQWRIDLLAVEQNAWALAGRDRRCVVMHSRTELDWAVQNGLMAVWAPSKIVLDSTDFVLPDQNRVTALCEWFCRQINAERLIVVGGKPTPIADIPASWAPLDQDNILQGLPNPD